MTGQGARDPAVSRREFLYRLGVGTVGGVFSLLLGVPLIGYFLSVLFRKRPELWVPVTTLDQISPEEPRLFRVTFIREDAYEPYKEERGVFVIRRGEDILAFTNVCTHMGCSVRWLDWREQILCPCHGGMYDRWGNVVGGPPPHSLPLFVSKVENNTLYVANRMQKRT